MPTPLFSAGMLGTVMIGSRRHGDTITEKKKGMEAVDLLCSRNARPLKGLVRRAHSRIHQVAPIAGNEQAWRGRGETADEVSLLAKPPR